MAKQWNAQHRLNKRFKIVALCRLEACIRVFQLGHVEKNERLKWFEESRLGAKNSLAFPQLFSSLGTFAVCRASSQSMYLMIACTGNGSLAYAQRMCVCERVECLYLHGANEQQT